MKRNAIKLTLTVLCGLVFTPLSAAAASAAIAVTDNTALYTIDFDFIAGDEAYRIPIGTQRDLSFDAGRDLIGYQIVGAEPGEVTNSNALVLSQQPIKNDMYHIPAGERASFTLVALVTISEETFTDDYSLAINAVPHYIGDTRTNVTNERLDRFRTPSATLNQVIKSATHTITIQP